MQERSKEVHFSPKEARMDANFSHKNGQGEALQGFCLQKGLDNLVNRISNLKRKAKDEPVDQSGLLLCFLDNQEQLSAVFGDVQNLKTSVSELNSSFSTLDETSLNFVSMMLLKSAFEDIINELKTILDSLAHSSFYRLFLRDFSYQSVLRSSLTPSEAQSRVMPKSSEKSSKLDIKDYYSKELAAHQESGNGFSPFRKTRKNNNGEDQGDARAAPVKLLDELNEEFRPPQTAPYGFPKVHSSEPAKPTEAPRHVTSAFEGKASTKTTYLSLVADLAKQGRISQAQKIAFKGQIVQDNPELLKAFRLFLTTHDQEQLIKQLNALSFN